ncbi:MAG TPA: diaminopimelate epimerase [Candidatus Baltobacteraceae bacterium]|nr:diaminopimelate epimerase [Candidatus Baltobacteraceae bacterium]
MTRLPFWKMSGAGNDFVVVDEAECDGLDRSWLARQLCTRALSVGADGLILMSGVDRERVRIRFFNPDGSPAEMCGNGSRCAARYAVDRRLVNPGHFRLLTDSGDLDVITGDGAFQVVMPRPENVQYDLMEIEAHDERFAVHGVQVGVPHTVVLLPDVERFSDEELTRIGRALRYDPHFPNGTNTNFVSLVPGEPLRQRTYERGVEALTKACGTGSTATAFVMTTHFGLDWPIELRVDGGRLAVDKRGDQLWLSGDARVIATGQIEPDAFSW